MSPMMNRQKCKYYQNKTINYIQKNIEKFILKYAEKEDLSK